MIRSSLKHILTSILIAILVAAAAGAAVMPFSQVHAASNFIIESMDIQMDVREDDTYLITETLDVHFTASSHGIYREIPAYVSLDRYGQHSAFYASVRDFEMLSGQKWEKENDGSDFRIRIGDPDKYEKTDVTYKYSYVYDMKGDHLQGADEVYHNLVGTDWEAKAIEKVSFRVTFPKDIDMNNVGMKTGNQEQVAFETEGNRVVKGSTEQDTLRGLTIRAVLPEGYFTRQAKQSSAPLYVIVGLIILFAACGIYLWTRYGRDPVVVETEEFYPPKGLSAPEVGYLDKGEVSADHVISILLTLADKGYIRIREKEEKAGLRKKKTKTTYEFEQVKPYKGRVIGEAAFMRGLFDDGERSVVTMKELEDRFYKTVNEIEKAIVKRYEDKLFDEKAGVFAHVLLFGSSLLMAALVIVSKIANGSPFIMDGDFIMSISLLLFQIVPIIVAFFAIAARIKKGKRGPIGYILWSLAIILPMPLMRLFDTFMPYQTIPFLIGTALCLLIAILSGFCEKKTDYYTDLLGKIRGYKRFLKLAEKDRMEMLAEQDPEYYYKNLAFAFALGVTAVYAERFASLAVKAPEWYVSGTTTGGSFDASAFSNSLDSMMSSVGSSMTSSPSSSGGGSFSGGGGSGGGGGGSW